MATVFSPRSRRSPATLRVVWLLPEPVRTAVTATTGFFDGIMVAAVPRRVKSHPRALTRAAMCPTYSWLTSL